MLTLRGWTHRITAKAVEWSPGNQTARGARSPHFWIITALMAFDIFLYYIDQTPLATMAPVSSSFLTGVHDIQRIFFFVPIIYAALIFRVPGALVTSFLFFCAVLPRALLISPYPDPLLRPLLFVISATLVSLLLATQLNRVEKERNNSAEVRAAYQELSELHQRLKESQEQLIHAEKLGALGQLAASVAHEINNPLSGVLLYNQLLAKRISNDKFSKENALDYLSKMESELTRTTKLVQSLLDFARQTPPKFGDVNVNDVISQALVLTTHAGEKQHIQIVKELDPTLHLIRADFSQLQQVCINLIVNAFQAMPKGGNLTLRTSANEGQIKIEVQDTGCGISPENMRKLFTPFFTTKQEVKGVGLGLAVSHGIIQRHRGRIEVQSKEGEGSTFTIYLPIHREEEEEEREAACPKNERNGGRQWR